MDNAFDSQYINSCLTTTAEIARGFQHEYMQTEHLALALIKNPDIQLSLKKCRANVKSIENYLTDVLVTVGIEVFPKVNLAIKGLQYEPKMSKSVETIIKNAVQQVAHSRRSPTENIVIKPYHLLASLLSETVDDNQNNGYAKWAFERYHVNRVTFLKNIINNKNSGANGGKERIDPETGEAIPSVDQALDDFCNNLNEKAKNGGIDPLIGREKEVERLIETLCKRKKNNPLLVGETGVGKTAIAEGLALKIIRNEVPKYLEKAVIYNLDMGALMAGARFRGDVEERLKAVLDALREVNKKEKAILFIDEIHTIIGAGATQGGTMDVGNLLKPDLADGKLRCIGSTTYDEYNKHFIKDAALKRRFHKIDIEEPTIEDAKLILHGVAEYFAKFHEVTYTDGAIDAAVTLSAKHIHDNRLPDKAIDIIDVAGAAQRIVPEDERITLIDTLQIEKVVARMARLPETTINQDERNNLKHLQSDVKNFVFGQDKAIEELVDAIELSCAGLRDPDKPIGSYLFSGPTGVGKTEVCKQLARNMGVQLVRFDMSEYMEKHSISKMLGAPPGYVGHDDGDGELIEAIDKHPHCVLLLDEIEKAHPDVFNILLQIMDNASLTGSRGKEVKFHNVVLIMTTNAGAQEMQKKAIGFGATNNFDAGDEAIKRLFAPEFRNRLDAMIAFDQLTPEVMLDVVHKFINQLQSQLDERGIEIVLNTESKKWLAKKGFDPDYGARPLARVIQNEIKKKMAKPLLYDKIGEYGGTIRVTVKDDKLNLDFEVAAPPIKEVVEEPEPIQE